ncbi:MAG: COG1470 family protein [Chloroflexota bacterium]
MRRLVLALLLSLMALVPLVVHAESAPQFRLGFKALADQIPDVVGEPIEDEHWGPNGDSLQRTTTGLMVWRKADNWTAFTNGATTWINGPFGVQSRPNDQRFDWEAADPAPQSPSPAEPRPQPVALQTSRQPAAVASSNSVSRFGVAEAFRNDASTQLGINWDRVILSWSGIQPNGPGDWAADSYLPPSEIQKDLDRGWDVVGLLQFTPNWAAQNPADGQRSVPRNLSLPAGDPNNYWAQFAGRVAAHYRGRIDRWIIWNEPEFRPGDKGAGQSYTWLGSDADYYMLMKRGYQAIKAANPNATVVFGATSYWVDVNMGRQPFFKRILDVAAADPEARTNSFFFDVASFNIYRAPDDLLRIHVEMKDAMKAKGIDKPIWLTETNAMPYDDPATPKPSDGQRVTMTAQGDYVAQALALSAAAGYQRVGWYRITDGGIWREQEVWGLMRDDGYPRPAFQAFKTVAPLFNGARKVSFVPLERETQPFGTPWPQNPNSYYPNWQVYQVVFDHADGRRVTVLWNATDDNLKVRVPKQGSSAVLTDKLGQQYPLVEKSGWYVVDLPSSNVRGPFDPQGYHYIGGQTFVLVQQGVPGDAPIQEPRLGEPGLVQPGVQMALDPAAFKFRPGETARFTLRLRGIEGFGSELRLSVKGLPAGARVEMPSTAFPGDRVNVAVHTEGSLKPGLYVDEIFIEATGGGVTARVPLNLEVVP